MISAPVVELRKVSKRYAVGNTVVSALEEVDISVSHGEYLAIVGPSGSGKSTALHILSSLDRPSEGEYFVEGRNYSAEREKNLARLRNRSFGFVFQQYFLVPELTALQNVALPLSFTKTPRKIQIQRASEALDKVEMSHRRNHFPRQLSGGEQQRVAIARAVCHDPVVIFGDEPTGNLAGNGRDKILEYLRHLHEEGSTIVIVTHDPVVSEQATRLISLSDGRVVNPLSDES